MTPALAPRLKVVHSSHGRLRVHLPDPGGQVTARLRCLPGVTSAEASDVTGNILLLFDPRQTAESILLAELQPGCPAAPPAPPRPTLPAVIAREVQTPQAVAVVTPGAADAVRPVVYLRGWRAALYKLLGWTSVGLAVVGAVLPGIPTVPFVLLAGYFFVRSSPEAHQWLRRSRWFGPMLRDWEQYRGVRRPVKYAVLGLLTVGLVIALLLQASPVTLALILTFGLAGAILVLRLPTVGTPLLAR